jgi:aminopeptidase N
MLERHGIEQFLSFYKDQGQVALYDFEQTTKISTYLYAVCAGNFKVLEDHDGMYPAQRIFVRQSLVENLRADLIFTVTKTTINFYQKSFGLRYPFTKIDHVMCPDYKHGAMENVGCITYADSLMCASKHMSVPQLTFVVVVI